MSEGAPEVRLSNVNPSLRVYPAIEIVSVAHLTTRAADLILIKPPPDRNIPAQNQNCLTHQRRGRSASERKTSAADEYRPTYPNS
jgi:hypothetical protein